MRLIAYEDLPLAAPRIYKVDMSRLNIRAYDIDNGYPQRMETMINASPTAKQSVAKLARFIIGQGFDKDGKEWNRVINSKGETCDELLEQVAKDVSKFDGFLVHFNYNALFHGVEARRIPWKHGRVGINEQEGKIAICATGGTMTGSEEI